MEFVGSFTMTIGGEAVNGAETVGVLNRATEQVIAAVRER